MIDLCLLLIACHFIGDFAFQSDWFVNFKGKSWEVNFYHAITYVAPFILFAEVNLLFVTILLVSHFIIDPLKARWHIVKTVWQDQLLHAAVLAACVLSGIAY